ncbi:hypothetical protein D3C85_1544990 [compost metagenome]
MPALRTPDPRLGKHSAAQFSVSAGSLLGLLGTDQQTLSADRTGLRPVIGLHRLAFRVRMGGLHGAGLDLGLAGDEPD